MATVTRPRSISAHEPFTLYAVLFTDHRTNQTDVHRVLESPEEAKESVENFGYLPRGIWSVAIQEISVPVLVKRKGGAA